MPSENDRRQRRTYCWGYKLNEKIENWWGKLRKNWLGCEKHRKLDEEKILVEHRKNDKYMKFENLETKRINKLRMSRKHRKLKIMQKNGEKFKNIENCRKYRTM